MATNLLSNFGAPTINGIAAQRVLSNQVLENLYQGLIESEGEGVTQRFSHDVSGAEIRIVHVKPIKAFARRLGSAVNGGNFPITAYEGETDSFGLRVLDVIDTPIDLARVSKDLIPVDLAYSYIKSYTDQVNANINGITIAGKFYATTLKEAKGEEVNITKYDGTDLYETVLTANSLLDEGAEEMGVATFPQNDRCLCIQTKYRATLLKKGVLVVGGANYAYDIVKDGTVSAGASPRKSEDGYIGTVDGVPTHAVAPLYFDIAAKYLGLEKEDLKQAIGYVSSSFANVRGIAATEQVKVIDHPDGQGTRFQPLTRFGFAVLPGYEKGNSFIVKNDYVNPYKSLKDVFGLTDFTIFDVIPKHSRIEIGASVSVSEGSITVTAPNAYKIACVVDSDGSINSVSKFGSVYAGAAATAKSNLVSGTAKSLTGIKSGSIVKVLCVAADGTCELSSATVA